MTEVYLGEGALSGISVLAGYQVRSSPAPAPMRWDGQTYQARLLVTSQSRHASHSHCTSISMHSRHDILPKQESVLAD